MGQWSRGHSHNVILRVSLIAAALAVGGAVCLELSAGTAAHGAGSAGRGVSVGMVPRRGLTTREVSVRVGSGRGLALPVRMGSRGGLTQRGVPVVMGSGWSLSWRGRWVSIQGWVALRRRRWTRGYVAGVVDIALRSAVPLVLAATRGHLTGVVETPAVLRAGATSPSRHGSIVPKPMYSKTYFKQATTNYTVTLICLFQIENYFYKSKLITWNNLIFSFLGYVKEYNFKYSLSRIIQLTHYSSFSISHMLTNKYHNFKQIIPSRTQLSRNWSYHPRVDVSAGECMNYSD